MKTIPSILLGAALITSAYADKVTDELDAATSAYKAGEYGEASSALQQALVFVNQKKVDSLKPFFSDNLINFKGDNITGNQSSGLFAAAGVILERKYKLDNKYFKVSLMLDSPMVTQFTSYINNPQMAAAMGLETRRIGTTKAMYNKKDHSIMFVYKNRFFINLTQAKHLTEEQALEIIKSLNYETLDNFK